MKSFLMSAAAIAVAATILVTPAITQTSNSAPANPPVAGSSGPAVRRDQVPVMVRAVTAGGAA